MGAPEQTMRLIFVMCLYGWIWLAGLAAALLMAPEGHDAAWAGTELFTVWHWSPTVPSALTAGHIFASGVLAVYLSAAWAASRRPA